MQIVLSGSLTQLPALQDMTVELMAHGLAVVAPEPPEHPPADPAAFLRARTRAYFSAIADPITVAVLAVNAADDSRIGASTLAELAVGFEHAKQLFCLHDLYAPLRDELTAWEVKPLHGDITQLLTDIR
jgi:hypothetical protein